MKAGIIGFTGYAGQELISLMARHGGVEHVFLDDRPENQSKHRALPCTAATAKNEKLDVIFAATDHKLSLQYVPQFLEAGCKVIDLSGAYRLKTGTAFQKWYHETHPQPDLLARAVYGLPELYREKIRGAQLIANPGCYPTAATLALRPLADAKVIDTNDKIVCHGASGISGAGRKAVEDKTVGATPENYLPYKILAHRHTPEILMHSGLESVGAKFNFVPHLLPAFRGILETIYVTVRPGVKTADLEKIYRDRYQSEPFVLLSGSGKTPQLKDVKNTNSCAIGFTLDEATGQAVVVSVIDNLVKGAAGQALQNMNIIMGFEETRGLPIDQKNQSRMATQQFLNQSPVPAAVASKVERYEK